MVKCYGVYQTWKSLSGDQAVISAFTTGRVVKRTPCIIFIRPRAVYRTFSAWWVSRVTWHFSRHIIFFWPRISVHWWCSLVFQRFSPFTWHFSRVLINLTLTSPLWYFERHRVFNLALASPFWDSTRIKRQTSAKLYLPYLPGTLGWFINGPRASVAVG